MSLPYTEANLSKLIDDIVTGDIVTMETPNGDKFELEYKLFSSSTVLNATKSFTFTDVNYMGQSYDGQKYDCYDPSQAYSDFWRHLRKTEKGYAIFNKEEFTEAVVSDKYEVS